MAAAFGDRPAAVIHSYSGPVDYGRGGASSSACRQLLRARVPGGEEASAEVAAVVPADRVLVETDSPFLAPPGRPALAERARMGAVTATWLAERRGTTLEALGDRLVTHTTGPFQDRDR